MTRAAERLHISLSAASTHVRAVEESFGSQLFLRSSRGLELTSAGTLLFKKSKALLLEATMLATFARELRGNVEGELVVGSDNDPRSSRLGHIVANLLEKHPQVRVDVRARPTVGTHQGLITGELDPGLLLERPIDTALTYYELATVRFHVVGPAKWKDRLRHASWEDLAQLPWIAPAGGSPSYDAMLREMFLQRKLELNILVHFDNPVVARAMVEAGVGLLLMREEHVSIGVASGALAVAPLARSEFPLFLSHLASRQTDPLIAAFLEATFKAWPEIDQTPVKHAL